MDNTLRIDSKRLATIDERGPTKQSAPEPRARRKRTSAAAEAAPTASPQADPPNSPRRARRPRRSLAGRRR